MEASQIPYKFATPWGADATSGYVTAAIPATASGGAASQQLGFPPITAQPTGSGGIPPNIADINGLGLYATLWAQWQQAGGPVIYDATFATAIGGYPKGAIIAAGALVGNSWLSTVDNNTADPDTGGANWELIGRPFVSNAQGANGDTTWTAAANGGSVFVNATSTQTLPAITGVTIGFIAAAGVTATLAASSGAFVGGNLSGSSLVLQPGWFWFGQFDGTNWRVVSAHPALFSPASTGTESSITLPNGIILKMGSFSKTMTGSTKGFSWSHSYPTAFPNNQFSAMVSIGSSASAPPDLVFATGSPATTVGLVGYYTNDDTVSLGVTINYVAMGN